MIRTGIGGRRSALCRMKAHVVRRPRNFQPSPNWPSIALCGQVFFRICMLRTKHIRWIHRLVTCYGGPIDFALITIGSAGCLGIAFLRITRATFAALLLACRSTIQLRVLWKSVLSDVLLRQSCYSSWSGSHPNCKKRA